MKSPWLRRKHRFFLGKNLCLVVSCALFVANMISDGVFCEFDDWKCYRISLCFGVETMGNSVYVHLIQSIAALGRKLVGGLEHF